MYLRIQAYWCSLRRAWNGQRTFHNISPKTKTRAHHNDIVLHGPETTIRAPGALLLVSSNTKKTIAPKCARLRKIKRNQPNPNHPTGKDSVGLVLPKTVRSIDRSNERTNPSRSSTSSLFKVPDCLLFCSICCPSLSRRVWLRNKIWLAQKQKLLHPTCPSPTLTVGKLPHTRA